MARALAAEAEAARLGGYLAVAESNRSPAVARALAAEAEVERLTKENVSAWALVRSEAEHKVAAEAQVSTAREALLALTNLLIADDYTVLIGSDEFNRARSVLASLKGTGP
jgi:hypothetical protein